MIDLIVAWMALGGTVAYLLLITHRLGMWKFWKTTQDDWTL